MRVPIFANKTLMKSSPHLGFILIYGARTFLIFLVWRHLHVTNLFKRRFCAEPCALRFFEILSNKNIFLYCCLPFSFLRTYLFRPSQALLVHLHKVAFDPMTGDMMSTMIDNLDVSEGHSFADLIGQLVTAKYQGRRERDQMGAFFYFQVWQERKSEG